MVSVTLLKVCCQSDVSFGCRRCSYSWLGNNTVRSSNNFFTSNFPKRLPQISTAFKALIRVNTVRVKDKSGSAPPAVPRAK